MQSKQQYSDQWVNHMHESPKTEGLIRMPHSMITVSTVYYVLFIWTLPKVASCACVYTVIQQISTGASGKRITRLRIYTNKSTLHKNVVDGE